MLSSESVALQQLGYHKPNIQDIKPGQAVIIQKGAEPVFASVQPQKRYCPDICELTPPNLSLCFSVCDGWLEELTLTCSVEFCYFARPDSVIDAMSVHQSRENMGYKLAHRIAKVLSPSQLKEIDVVMPIPDTSNTTAPCVAASLNKPYRQGFIKNRYVFRTFIMPGQKARQKGVRRKLNAMEQHFAGKNVLLVDDSIVRGTTSREIVLMAKEAGAKKIFFASAAPRIRYPHIYGIDLSSPSELIAHKRTVDEIATHIGAEKVIFQELDDLIDAYRQAAPSDHTARETQDFEVGVFNGQYVTPVPDGYFVHLERVRGENKKMKMIESARGAVANGSADPEEIKMATNGAEVKDDGSVVASRSLNAGNMPVVNGNGSPLPNAKRKRTLEEQEKPKRPMDISMHNQHDFEVED